jgi:hypothetical protein
MKIRTIMAAVGVAVVLGTTAALALPAVASAHNAPHTLTFVSVLKKIHVHSKTTVAEQDTDVNGAGKTIGFDELFATQMGKTTGKADIAFAENGGFLYGVLIVIDNGARSHGKVIGGAGTFNGATGTITAKPANNSGTKNAVTITYTS